jgi:hypothetical protein
MALDDVLNDAQAHQTTQYHDAFTQPPGAVITGFPSLTRPRQAGFPSEDLLSPGHLDAGVRQSTQMPMTFSMDSQHGGSDSTPPLPTPAHVLKLRPSFFR